MFTDTFTAIAFEPCMEYRGISILSCFCVCVHVYIIALRLHLSPKKMTKCIKIRTTTICVKTVLSHVHNIFMHNAHYTAQLPLARYFCEGLSSHHTHHPPTPKHSTDSTFQPSAFTFAGNGCCVSDFDESGAWPSLTWHLYLPQPLVQWPPTEDFWSARHNSTESVYATLNV